MGRDLDDLMQNAARGTGPFSPDEEREFRKWYAKLSGQLKLGPNPDDREHYYDYRGFYDAAKRGEVVTPQKPGDHFTSQFKSPDHPDAYMKDRGGRVFNTMTGKFTDDGSDIPEDIDYAPLPPEERRKYGAGANEASPDVEALLRRLVRDGR
jgi:hypothetical protein